MDNKAKFLSMLRPFVMSIFGWRVVVGFFSMRIVLTPCSCSSSARVSPTGPPPAISTDVLSIGFML